MYAVRLEATTIAIRRVEAEDEFEARDLAADLMYDEITEVDRGSWHAVACREVTE